MRMRILAVAAGLALVSGPALAEYRLCVTLTNPALPPVLQMLEVEVGHNGLWSPIAIPGADTVCELFSNYGPIRVRVGTGTPLACGGVDEGRTRDVHIRPEVNQNSQIASCAPSAE